MPYTEMNVIKTYYPTDDILIQHVPNLTTNSTTYVKLMTFKIVERLGSLSKFRFIFNLFTTNVGTEAFGKWYRNDVPIGTERHTISLVPVTYSEDINTTNFKVGDEIQMYMRGSNATDLVAANELRICGVGSEWLEV